MGDRNQPPQLQVHQRPHGGKTNGGGGPTVSKVIAIVTLLPVGGTLLALSGVALFATLVGLAVATPLFVIFSPVIVPAAAVIGLAVLAFLASGAFGLTGVWSTSCSAAYLQRATMALPGALQQAKQLAGQVGQKARDVGHTAQTKAQEATR